MDRHVALEQQLISSGLERRTGVDQRRVRIIVRALAHYIESAVRNEQLFALPDVVYARRRAQLDALDVWNETRRHGRALWELDGRLVAGEIELGGEDSPSWLITLTDVVPLIDDAVRRADPSITDEEIDQVIFSASKALSSLPPDHWVCIRYPSTRSRSSRTGSSRT
jgi:hypothetical protein